MAKKRSARKHLSPGTRIRIKQGVTAPEFPDVACEGWTGQISEVTGKKSNPKYVIEWDESVITQMPPSYIADCEQRNLLYRMACFLPDEVEEWNE